MTKLLLKHLLFTWSQLRLIRVAHIYTNHTQRRLTEAAELADDVGQTDICDTFQLTADVGWDCLATHMPRLNVPCNQRHGRALWVGKPSPEERRLNVSIKNRHQDKALTKGF